MSEYQPGTVAVVTWDNASIAEQGTGKSRIQTARAIRTSDGFWSLTERWDTCVDDCVVTDVRTLVVLDLDDPQALIRDLTPTRSNHVARMRDQIEAQTTRPGIPEPGLWGVVEASVAHDGRYKFVRAFADTWLCTADSSTYSWAQLIDPTLVREGVDDA